MSEQKQKTYSEIVESYQIQTIRSKFIKDTKFVIPLYQREYSWTQVQVEKLCHDYIEACERDAEHYTGSIIYTQAKNSNKECEIIDGQQRITSVFLMYIAVMLFGMNVVFEYNKNAIEKHHDEEDIVKDKIIFELCPALSRAIQDFKIDKYNEEFLKNKIEHKFDKESGRFQKLSKISKDEINLFDELQKAFKTINTSKYEDGYELKVVVRATDTNFQKNLTYFYKAFEKYYEESEKKSGTSTALELLTKLVNGDFINCAWIKLSDEQYAASVFKAINTTGVRLKSTDLIRSYLMCLDKDDKNEIFSKFFKTTDERFKEIELLDNYHDFWLVVIKAILIRNKATCTDNNKYSYEYGGEQVTFTIKNGKSDLDLYENFKRVFHIFNFKENKEKFIELLECYRDYFILLQKGEATEENVKKFYNSLKLEKNKTAREFCSSLFENPNNNQKNPEELFWLMVQSKLMTTTFAPNLFVLFERIDPRSKELEKLNVGKCLEVMHLLWSFCIRASLNVGFFGNASKVTDTQVNFAWYKGKEIYEKLHKDLVGTNSIRAFKQDSLESFIKAMFENNKNDTIKDYLSIVNYCYGCARNESDRTVEHIMPQSWDNEDWNESNIATIVRDRDELNSLDSNKSYIKDLELRLNKLNKTPSLENIESLYNHYGELIGNKLLLNGSKNFGAGNSKLTEKLKYYDKCVNHTVVGEIKQTIENYEAEGKYAGWGFYDIVKFTEHYAELIYKLCSPLDP